MDDDVTVTKIADGEMVEYRGRRQKQTTRLGQTFEVKVGDVVVGYVTRQMVTRERKTPGRTYVNARWQSPGWTHQHHKHARSFESYSKTDAIDTLVRDHRRHLDNSTT